MSEGNSVRGAAQLDPIGSCYVGLKQREFKDGKTHSCQHLHKKMLEVTTGKIVLSVN